MRNSRIIALFTFLLTSFFSYAQGTVKVTGKVIEQETKQPLEFATIILQGAAGTTKGGGLTGPNGDYSVDVAPGTYTIKIEFISFEPVIITGKEITGDTELGVTALAPDATMLGEVEIIAERSTVDIKLDKKVYNVGQDMIVKGGTVSDVLDNVPSVSVDVEGNVSLRGNESVTILIDGRPSALAGGNVAEVLRLLPADSVEKVEVITNPSARYDAEGGGGIINIILRKGKAGGFNGSVIVSGGHPETYGVMANLNYRSENFNLFSNLGYNYRSNKGRSFTDSRYLDDFGNTTRFVNERRENENIRKGLNATLGMELFLNETTTWTNSLSIRESSGESPSDVFYNNYFADGAFDFTRHRYSVEDEEDTNVQFSTNLVKKFNDDGHELRIDASFSTSTDVENTMIEDMVLGSTTPGTDNTIERTLNDEDEGRSLVQADYVLPIGEESRFEAGYRGSFNSLKTDSAAEFLLPGGAWTPNEDFTSLLEYNENVNAFYTQYGSKIGQFSYLLGLRWEDTNIDVNLLNRGDYNNKKYNNFFPSAVLTYEFSESSSTSLSYSRRINRPRGRWINPFPGLSSNINIFQGNPDLDPSMTNAFDLGYLKRWRDITFSTSAYINITDDSYQFVRRLEGTNPDGIPISITTPINLAKEYRFGFEFNVNYNPYRWWRINGNFNFYRNETDGDYTFTYTAPSGETISDFQNFDYTAYSWFTRVNSKVNLPWKIDWQLNGTYNAPRETAQGRSRGIISANTAISKDLFNERATLTLNVSDIFNSRKRKVETYIPGEIDSYSEMQWRQRQITLSFTYRFNMKKNERAREQRQQENGGDDDFMGE